MIQLHYHRPINVDELIYQTNEKVHLLDGALDKAQKCFEYLNQTLTQNNRSYYGINTGFGSLCNVRIEDDQLVQLQENLIKSHSCGVGKELPPHITKWIVLSKIQNLLLGHSAVNKETILRLVEMFNNEVYPVIYQQGSLGASGDLAPLAHLSLTLIGEGEVYFNNQKISTKELYQKLGWQKLRLHPKEGLALLNGTQYMSGIGIYLMINVLPLFTAANVIAAVSLEAFHCRYEPFDEHIHNVRSHKGQSFTAQQINAILKDSPNFYSTENKAVQDPYSFRCIPQVHGASYDLIQFIKSIIETEVNSVTDNPLIFPDENLILSGGNFHGQILSNAFDTLALALNQLGGISERRVYQLISGIRGLPAFLVKHPGLHSGFMIPQYTAASLVNRNKILCTPASADSIVSSNGQEDYVSMGSNAANKCIEIFENVKELLAIELFTAAQALNFRQDIKSSKFIHQLLEEYRTIVPFIEKDTTLYGYIHATKKFIENKLLEWYSMFNK
ncbi:MAG: histidine ammonia-lyase [Bacteroidia bacterium]|nr:histidine ammonia-lyase [Bacteroidia bacterium]